MPDTTVGDVMERLYRNYLEPPTYQPIIAWLSQLITSTTQTTILVGSFGVPEDKELLRTGIVLEIGSELMIVRGGADFAASPVQLTVKRGQYGTTPATHDVDSIVKLHPRFPRASVFEQVRDNIISLHPKLFTVRTINEANVGYGLYTCPDPLAISVERARPFEGAMPLDVRGEVVDHHPMTDGRAFQFPGMVGDLWITYRRRMGVATSEDDLLEDLGVEDVWVPIIMAGAAADLMAGRDIPTTVFDWVTDLLEKEGMQVGTQQSLAVGLRRYRDYLLEGYSGEMQAEYKPKVVRRSPFARVGRV